MAPFSTVHLAAGSCKTGCTWANYRLVQHKPADIRSVCTAVFPAKAGLTTGICQRDMLENQHPVRACSPWLQALINVFWRYGVPVRTQRHSRWNHSINIVHVSTAICQFSFCSTPGLNEKKVYVCTRLKSFKKFKQWTMFLYRSEYFIIWL